MSLPFQRIIDWEAMVRIVIISLCVAACDVGELPGLTDSGMGSGGACPPIASTIPVGHHNEGMGCMSAAACHNQALGLGVAAPAYSYGGTLYKADKVTPFPGATIIVKMGSAEKKVTSADNGNFWIVPGVAGMEPPTNTMTGATEACAGPNSLKMVGILTAGGGDCNKGLCHTPGVGQGAVYLQE
jgi:hypothetical protein